MFTVVMTGTFYNQIFNFFDNGIERINIIQVCFYNFTHVIIYSKLQQFSSFTLYFYKCINSIQNAMLSESVLKMSICSSSFSDKMVSAAKEVSHRSHFRWIVIG